MSHIEGDGVIEDIYYLLWRKDSPYNEKLNLRIPDTVIFRKGRPMAWYYTNNDGAVMRKKQTSLVYPEILKKFTKGATEGEIVAYFVNIDHEKKLGRLLDKNYYRNPPAQDSNNEDETPCHDVEYFGLSDFTNLFSDYKKFEGKTGILQRFIQPYGSNNELIQAIWSPRVCVFTKRVNLRRLNETRFDIYERALTFDGPDFYSKNVPLRGGYIPGKLRATCDNIVRHVAFISYEKVSINRLVGYFKVDQNENVWFLWTSSIRVGETSKAHKRISQFIDKPLCLEPCMQTSTNIRHVKSNFSTRPVTLRMNEECSVCAVKVSTVSLIPVVYRLLLGNETILKRSEKLASKLRIRTKRDIEENNGPKLKSPKKSSTIGVPYFIKKLHPEMTLKAFQSLKEKEHFLMMKTSVCEECYLIVSQEYEGGFPCSLNEPNDRRGLKSARTTGRRASSVINESGSRKERSATPERPSRKELLYESAEGYDTVKESDSRASAHLYMTSATNRQSSADTRTINSHRLNINPEPTYANGIKAGTPSTLYGTLPSNRSSDFPKFLNRTLWAKPAKGLNKIDPESGFSNLEETKFDSAHQDHSNLKKDLMKAFSGVFDGKGLGGRSVTSMSKISLGQSMNKVSSARKPSRPQTSAVENSNKKGRIIKAKSGSKKQTLSQYKLDEVPDLFNDSDSSEDIDIKKYNPHSYRQPLNYQTPRDLQRKEGSGTPGVRPLSTECPENLDSVRVIAGIGKGRNKLKGYLAEINPEVKIQEHLDQDMIFTMANANKKNENIPILQAQPASMREDKKSPYNNSYSHREYSQDATNYQSPYNLMAPSGRSTKTKSKSKCQSVINENEACNDIGNIVDKYYDLV